MKALQQIIENSQNIKISMIWSQNVVTIHTIKMLLLYYHNEPFGAFHNFPNVLIPLPQRIWNVLLLFLEKINEVGDGKL